jgi:aldose 1-epimerase
MSRTLPAVLLLAAAVPARAAGPAVEQEPFGKTPAGDKITAYTLVNRAGAKVKVIDYGAIVTEIHVPDKAGKLADVALGFDTLAGYLSDHPYFGSNAGRVANRIAGAKFTLDGKEYKLEPNNGPNLLHGGKEGFNRRVWRGETLMGAAGPAVKLAYTSPDGEMGFPGALSVVLQYTLTNDNELKVEYSATTTKPTLCNLAHHSYFNLAGHDAGDILGHEVQIFAKNYTPTDDTLIPTGKIAPVAGTPFDFTTPTAIGKRLKETGGSPVGYDLNYVLDAKAGGVPNLAARVTEPKGGRVLEVYTDQPGLQFYTGNFLNGTNVGKGGAVYRQYGGFCLEAQKFPDAVNRPEWKDVSNPVLRPGEEYRQTTVYRFTVAK